MPLNLRHFLAPIVSLGLVAGTWTDWQMFHLLDGEPSAYHAAVRALADRLPEKVGDWTATPVEVPARGVAPTRPNLLEAREYRHASSGERVTFTILQCRDPRDLQAYWPPVYYPAQGWTLRETNQKSMDVQDLRIPVTVYRFTFEAFDRYSEMVVYNFLLRPGGRLVAGRTSVHEDQEDARLSVLGAAQVQVAFGPSVAADRRDEIFRTLMIGARSLMDVVLEEVGR